MTFNFDEFFSKLDISAIENPKNKILECQFFYELAAREEERSRFRWLVSAFLGAAYSYFEVSALSAHVAFTHPETGEPGMDVGAVRILEEYVTVSQSGKNMYYVKTSGKHKITKELYEIRKKNTHYMPLSIMQAGRALPEDFQFGSMRGDGVPALAFCREVLQLIQDVQIRLDA